jgi:hypothetical protein
MYLLCRLVILVSLLFLLILVRCFFLYTLCVFISALRFLMIVNYLSKKYFGKKLFEVYWETKI